MKIVIELPRDWRRRVLIRTIVNQVAGQGFIRILLPTGRIVTIPAGVEDMDD